MASTSLFKIWKPRKKLGKKQDFHLPTHHHHHKAEVEILKTVAQAWFGRHNSSASTLSPNEFDAHRRNFHGQPSRFRIEAMRKQNKNKEEGEGSGASGHGSNWDFKQSLWDPCEIVAVSKRLEEGLEIDNGFSGLFWEDGNSGVLGVKKRRDSKNSLRNLFNMVSSRRFNDIPITYQDRS